MKSDKVIVDADILSMFAKADAIDLLQDFLGRERVAMTPAIRDEVSAPLQYGYTFPQKILSRIPVVSLTARSWQEYERTWEAETALGRGELEAVAFCSVEEAVFTTNDYAAQTLARSRGVRTVSLQAILRGLWVSGMRDKAEVRRHPSLANSPPTNPRHKRTAISTCAERRTRYHRVL